MVMPLVTIVGPAENVHFDVFRIGGRPQFANIVSGLSSRGPEVTVGADVAIHVEVVEQDELPRQSVLIGCYSLAEEHQVRFAVAFPDVAQHLIVGPILLDDIDNVANRIVRGFGGKGVDHALLFGRWGIWMYAVNPVGQLDHARPQPLEIGVGQRLNASTDQIPDIVERRSRIRPVGVRPRSCSGVQTSRVARTLHRVAAVSDKKLVGRDGMKECRGVSSHGKQPLESRSIIRVMARMKDSKRVDCGQRHVKPSCGSVKCQGVRLRPSK